MLKQTTSSRSIQSRLSASSSPGIFSARQHECMSVNVKRKAALELLSENMIIGLDVVSWTQNISKLCDSERIFCFVPPNWRIVPTATLVQHPACCFSFQYRSGGLRFLLSNFGLLKAWFPNLAMRIRKMARTACSHQRHHPAVSRWIQKASAELHCLLYKTLQARAHILLLATMWTPSGGL